MMHRVLITGGRGFVGKALVERILDKGFSVRVSSRQALNADDGRLEFSQVGDLSATTNWDTALKGVETVVHCAGRAHMSNDLGSDALSSFQIVNLEGTLNLARQAVAAGVKRFVFISSIGVNGLQTEPNKAFCEADTPNPHNAYALSKWKAEQGLLHIADETGLQVVIIRPPLVYGFNAPGNFGLLMRAVQRGWPLPLGAICNKRSLIALDNLVDFIIVCITNPQAANQTFLVSDGQDLSTAELVRGIARAAGVRLRLLWLPLWTLTVGAALLGKSVELQRICGNLQVDISKARNILGWSPPVSVEKGLLRAAHLECILDRND